MTTLLFSLFLSLSAQSYTVDIQHNGPVEFDDVNLVASGEAQLTSGRLMRDTEIYFNDGNKLEVSKGTRVGFYPSVSDQAQAQIFDLIITDSVSETDWKFSDDLTLEINCSRPAGSGASFVSFNRDGKLIDGCFVTEGVSFSDEEKELILSEGSKFKINEQGELIYGQIITSGEISINEQRVKLLEGHSIAFHENGVPFFIHLDFNEHLDSSTEYGLVSFGQVARREDNDVVFPTTFFENGNVESGLNVGENLTLFYQALGESVQHVVSTGSPLRLREDGSVHQVLLTASVTLTSQVEAQIVRREVQYGITQSLSLTPGAEFVLPPGAQLIIENHKLTGLTHRENSGLSFVYTIEEALRSSELSLEN